PAFCPASADFSRFKDDLWRFSPPVQELPGHPIAAVPLSATCSPVFAACRNIDCITSKMFSMDPLISVLTLSVPVSTLPVSVSSRAPSMMSTKSPVIGNSVNCAPAVLLSAVMKIPPVNIGIKKLHPAGMQSYIMKRIIKRIIKSSLHFPTLVLSRSGDRGPVSRLSHFTHPQCLQVCSFYSFQS